MVDAVRRSTSKDSFIRPTGELPEQPREADSLTPKEIVAELDRYIVGQEDAKRAVAVALRNRYRRQQLPEEMRREVQPKNILMIGSTGVGKTEIARRVARIVDAPFIKVEATKFTEVGYVGRDVESIVRDLVEIAISMLHGERLELVKEEASHLAVDRLTEILSEQELSRSPRRSSRKPSNGQVDDHDAAEREAVAAERRRRRQQKRVRELLDQEAMEDETVEIELEPEDDGEEMPSYEIIGGVNPEELQDTFYEFLDGLLPRRRIRRRVSVREARSILAQQEANRMVDFDAVVEAAIRRVEDAAVVFIDELDKTVSGEGDGGPDVSGEGVQRDLLPIVEGSAVMTRYGPVNTDHILFIAAGAFHHARPSDLIPELQGRFPIRVELQALSEDDLFAILTEPQNALTKQYEALLATEGLSVTFSNAGLREVAKLATLVNSRTEDIGARRLQTILERVLEEISFEAPDMDEKHIEIDEAFVTERVGEIADDDELSNFIL
ncbi:MAG: ATP-dependent hsl protease ATP-binding subunit HslU [uncultured Thermomicrobiales bacterium]|uniref:ATP-dependent hsl protease ATP-binding subunit HslU n=1 Tax=uncultured Thermomicrobiales bacterium TaxID=1645740 RepID=A0A6J4UZM5_9BACT|nr:MAG: ATP-dependent hsl protease ATP-binding subunit HslU [uncultured Thermomicrobiales bacterium]